MIKTNRFLVKDIIEEISMGPFGSNLKVEFFKPVGFPVLNGSNLTDVRLVEDAFNYVTEEKARSLGKAIASKGDVIITHRGTLGQVSYIPDDSLYDEYLISQSQFRVRFDKEIANPAYIAYYFKTKEGQKKLLSFASYVGVPALAQATTNFKEIELNLPSLEIQNKIVDELLTLDLKIENNNSINAELESMAKTLYDYWFLQFEFPNEEGKPYKSSGGKMVWNEELKREIPEGWEVKQLGNLIEYNRGISYTGKDISENGIPIISLASIDRTGRYIPDGIKYFNRDYASSKVVKPFELIMANTDMTQERAVMGKIVFVPDIFDGDILTTHHITQIYTNESLKAYLMMTTQTDWFHNYIKGFASGTNVLGMDMKGFDDYMLTYPSKDILSMFNRIIFEIYRRIFVIYKENFELASLRDFLLPLLMNGQVGFKNTIS